MRKNQYTIKKTGRKRKVYVFVPYRGEKTGQKKFEKILSQLKLLSLANIAFSSRPDFSSLKFKMSY